MCGHQVYQDARFHLFDACEECLLREVGAGKKAGQVEGVLDAHETQGARLACMGRGGGSQYNKVS
jgi:hypothetical protein